MQHRIAALLTGLLLLGAAAGCADQCRCDAAEAAIARLRVEAAQRDAQIAELRSDELALAERLAARDTAGSAGGSKGASPPTLPLVATPSANATLRESHLRGARKPTRRLDETIPYSVVPYGAAGARFTPQPAVRRLDETVPYP